MVVDFNYKCNLSSSGALADLILCRIKISLSTCCIGESVDLSGPCFSLADTGKEVSSWAVKWNEDAIKTEWEIGDF